MRTSNDRYCLLVLLLLVGCGGDEPATSAAEEPANSPAATPQSEPAIEPAPEDETPGLAVGEQAPAFELKDQNGQLRTLAGMLKTGTVALVFYRSADW